MLIDTRTVPHDQTFEADLCIVGAGAAGITIAREFANKGRSVIVLERGGFEFNEKTQALYAGEAVGMFRKSKRSYVSRVRLRYFGGSTNHWEGWCRPLDAIDFEERSWIPIVGGLFQSLSSRNFTRGPANCAKSNPSTTILRPPFHPRDRL